MRNYRVINDYRVIVRTNIYRTIKDLRSNLYYSIWADYGHAICYDRNPSTPKGIGYSKILKEAFVFEFDDIIWYK